MADSAFNNPQPTAPQIEAVDNTLIQPTLQQIQPTYDANLFADEAGREIERKLPPSKLELKSLNLQDKLAAKQEAIGPVSTPEGAQPRTSGLGRLLQSSAITTGANLADSAIELGSNIVGGAADVTGLRSLYSEEEQEAAATFLDPYTEASYGDEVAGYDRTNLAQTQKDVLGLVQSGEYMDAFTKGLTIAPEVLTESIPYIATLGVGGRLKLVNAAGKAAKAEAFGLGGTAAMQAKAAKDAIKVAEKSLSAMPALANLGAKNAGLLAMSGTQVKDQNEEFIKNNNGEGMSAAQMTSAMAVNVVMNGLDRGIFTSILGLKKNAKDLAPVWGQLPKASKAAVAKKVAGIATGMGKEAGQEYLQEWGQIVNENWGADGQTLSDVLSNKGGNDQAVTAAILGAGAGGLTSVPTSVIGAANELGKGKKAKKQLEAALSTVKPGYKNATDKATHTAKVDQDYDTTKEGFDALETAEAEIKKVAESNASPMEKVLKIQSIMSQTRQGDKATDVLVRNLGGAEVSNILKEIEADKELMGNKKIAGFVEQIKKQKTPAEQYLLLSRLVPNLSAKHQKIKDSYNENINEIEKQATELTERTDNALEITYNNSKTQLNAEGNLIKGVKDELATVKDPKTEQDIAYEDLVNLPEKELQAKLAEYDSKTVAKIIKQAQAARKKAKGQDAVVRADAHIGKLRKFYTSIRNAVKPSSDNQVKKTAKNLLKTRNKAKKLYDPKAPLIQRVKAAVTEKFEAIKVQANQIKNGQKPRTPVSKEDLKTAAKETVTAISNLKDIDPADIPVLAATIDHLNTIGLYSEQQAKKLKAKLEKYMTEKKAEIDAKVKEVAPDGIFDKVRKVIASKIDKIRQGAINLKESEAMAFIEDQLETLKNKMTPTELKALADTLAYLESKGTITKEFAEAQLAKVGTKQGPLTPEEAAYAENAEKEGKTTLKQMFEDAKTYYEENSREEIEQDIKKKAGEATKKVKKAAAKVTESKLGEAIVEDIKALPAILVEAFEDANIKEKYTALVKRVSDIDSLELYQSVKDLGTLNKNDHEVEVVTEIDIDIDNDTKEGC